MATAAAESSRDAAAQQRAAVAELRQAFGPGGTSVTAWAPGRCTLVGDHVDYAGGMVLSAAIGLGVAVALRPSADDAFRVVSAGRVVERVTPEPVGDIGDRIFAAVTALRDAGVALPPVEVGLSATLPESVGLASSAAITCAVITALLRLANASMPLREVIATALLAEHDIVGVPCGPLDPTAIIAAPAGGALLLDCATATWEPLAWPWDDVVLCICATAESHDVGGSQYRLRRGEVESALRTVGAANCQSLSENQVAAGSALPVAEARRLRHVVAESARAVAAAQALRQADAQALGELMSASHRSLRDDQEVSTDLVDAVVTAACRCDGCFGARIVGAGFGGSVLALVSRTASAGCAAAMAATAGVAIARTWVLTPSEGLAEIASDVIRSG